MRGADGWRPATRAVAASWPLVLLSLVFIGSAVEIAHVAQHPRGGVAGPLIAVATLVVATVTLYLTVPRPAKLVVARQDELGLTDLVFYLYPDPRGETEGDRVLPKDYLLQLTVAICNLGNRKAVLSGLILNEFTDSNGASVALPGAPAAISAERYEQQRQWRGGSLDVVGVITTPPFVLEPDDVISLRFRTRRGVDWSERWTLEELRRFHEALLRDVVAAKGTMIWRRANTVLRSRFEIPVVVEQQRMYRDRLALLTSDFTARPEIPTQQMTIE